MFRRKCARLLRLAAIDVQWIDFMGAPWVSELTAYILNFLPVLVVHVLLPEENQRRKARDNAYCRCS